MKTPINFEWAYLPEHKEEYINKKMPNPIVVNLPHTNIELPFNYIDEKSYQFTSTYQKELSFNKDDLKMRNFVRFEGSAHKTSVYLNGEHLITHECGYTPFEFELKNAVEGVNLLTAVVNSSEKQNLPPFGKVIDFLTYGGIYREVYQVQRNSNYIKDVYVGGKNLLDKPEVFFEIETDQPINAEVKFTLECGEDKRVFTANIKEKKSNFSFELNNVKLWDLNQPNLYNVRSEIEGLEAYNTRTGFRQCEFTPTGFMLNGEHIDIMGLNRHQSYPYVGYAMPKSAQKKDANIVKFDLGCNMVRTSHYPQSQHFLDACDEIGLLVMEEIPGWQHVGDEEWQAITIKSVEEMVTNHRNHPSIIIWGTRINESQDFHEFYKKTSEIAHKNDKYRQVGGVRNISMIKPDKEAWIEDVYTYNDFIYWPGHPLTDVKEVFPVPNIPGIVTEHSGHTYPTKSFDNELRRLTHALRHMDIINRMRGDKQICGTIGWCAFDYNTHIEFGSGDRICYHGVMDMFRLPKLAGLGYKMQNSKDVVLETSTNFTIGEYDRAYIPMAYIFTNCDYVEVYRNNEIVGKMYPDKERFPYLEHPPILLDWFGDVLIEKEGFSKEKSDRYKKIHNVYMNYDIGGEPEEYKDLISNKAEVEEVMDLHGKYIQNWSSEAVVYKIVGFIDGKAVKEIIRGGEYDTKFSVYADSDKLKQDETYDVVRICCEYQNNNGYRLAYAQDPLIIETDDKLELIGPSIVSLAGGAHAFWVKTKKDIKGKSKIVVRCGKHTKELEFEIV